MRITRRPSLPGVAGPGNTSAAAPTTTAPAKPEEPSAGDRVDLSQAARLRQRVRSDIGNLDQTDGARVTELRTLVAAGTYTASPEAVAKSLLGEIAADLLG